MKLLLFCLIIGLNLAGFAASADTPSPVQAYVRYIKLVTTLDTDPTYAKVQDAEATLLKAHRQALTVFAEDHYVQTQRKFLRLFGTSFADLEPGFAAAYPDAVTSTFAGGERVVFKPNHPLARAFNLDPYGVDHPWNPFVYTGPADRSFLDEAHAFVAESAPAFLTAALEQIQTDPTYLRLLTYGKTISEFPEGLDLRYRPVFTALRFAFKLRGPQALRHSVTSTPIQNGSVNYVVQDSLENLLDFDQAKKNFVQVIEMLDSYAQSCADDLAA